MCRGVWGLADVVYVGVSVGVSRVWVCLGLVMGVSYGCPGCMGM